MTSFEKYQKMAEALAKLQKLNDNRQCIMFNRSHNIICSNLSVQDLEALHELQFQTMQLTPSYLGGGLYLSTLTKNRICFSCYVPFCPPFFSRTSGIHITFQLLGFV